MYQEVIDEGVRAGKLEDLGELTEEVGYFQVLAEGQSQYHQTVEQGDHCTEEQWEYNEQNAEMGVHDNCVPQGVTNGHIAVIGHCCKKKILKSSPNHNKAYLGEAAHKSDALTLCLDVHQKIWEGDCAYTDVSEGQVAEEEVHGGMQVGVRADGQDDEQVSQHSGQVDGEEQVEKERLQLWVIRQSQQ